MDRSLKIISLLAVLLGCGSNLEPWGEVSGIVLQDGQPVEPAVVLFSNREAGVEYTGETGPDGRFTIRTDRLNGLPVGTYKVAILPRRTGLPQPEQGMMFTGPPPQPQPTKIPTTEQDLASTRLAAEVKTGHNEFVFHLVP